MRLVGIQMVEQALHGGAHLGEGSHADGGRPLLFDRGYAVAGMGHQRTSPLGQADEFGNKNMVVHGRAEVWPWQGIVLAAHGTRFFSILLGGITIFFTYRTAQIVFLHRPGTPIIAALLVALNPQF